MLSIKNSATPCDISDWVTETKFGKWFLSTDIWYKYVLTETTIDIKHVLNGRLAPGSILLDAGCGIGLSFSLIDEHLQPKKIIGLDIDKQALEISAASTTKYNCQVELIHGSAKQIDLPDNSVDAIYCHQLIHHVGDQEALLKELYRVIRPGGFLLSSESCRSFIHSFWVRLLFRHPEMVQKEAHEYVELIRDAGFSVEENDIKTSTPWWSRVDCGILEKLKIASYHPGITEVITVGIKH